MTSHRAWASYPATYRAREVQMLTDWIRAGESGSVVGLVGCGRSSLLGFLCHRPDVLRHYLPKQADRTILVPVDIYDLPANDLANLYRTILHAFYWIRERFPAPIKDVVTQVYQENRAVQDPFLSQRALYDLILLFQQQQFQVVLVLNRFDHFCQVATPQMLNTLRGLRDHFKETLSYLVGMVQEVVYLPDPSALGGMYDLLDMHVCWVGALVESDARHMLDNILHTAPIPPTTAEVAAMLALSGRFPTLLRAVGRWWWSIQPCTTAMPDWCECLLAETSVQHRLERIWNGLTQEEKLALSEVQKGSWRELSPASSEQCQPVLARLVAKGLCHPSRTGWRVNGELLAAYIAQSEGRVRGKIWLDEEARVVYQGQELLEDLAGLQYEILSFLIKNPRIRHTRDDIIDNAWPEEEQREGITPNALQVHIASIRKKIEPNPAQPHYLITWHGRPGGYQFFPEGKPE